jgi:hypothetical protein
MRKGGSVSVKERSAMPEDALGREKAVPAGSVTCTTSTMIRRSWCARGNALLRTGVPGPRASTRPRWPRSRPGRGPGFFLGQIRDALKSGEYALLEVRQVMIPKANGRLRKLGIATVADLVVQASLKLGRGRWAPRKVIPPWRRGHGDHGPARELRPLRASREPGFPGSRDAQG